MAESIRDNGLTAKPMVMVRKLGPMVRYGTTVNGNTISQYN